MPRTASGSFRSNRNAARPIAGAVFRPTGSATICRLSSLGSWRAMAERRSSFVITQKSLPRCQWQQPAHGLLDHGLFTVEGQQLLGAPLAAQWPEARSPSAGEYHGIEMRISNHK